MNSFFSSVLQQDTNFEACVRAVSGVKMTGQSFNILMPRCYSAKLMFFQLFLQLTKCKKLVGVKGIEAHYFLFERKNIIKRLFLW